MLLLRRMTHLGCLLLFLGISHSGAAEDSAGASRADHIGTWKTQTPKGDSITWIFTPRDAIVLLPGNRGNSISYEIDYTKKPIWLTFTKIVQGARQEAPLMIVEFVGSTRMRVVGPPRRSLERPESFDNRGSDVLIFERQP